MSHPSPKSLIWFLEEATGDVAELMHQLERSLGTSASTQRVSATEALRQLPRPAIRSEVAAIIVFSVDSLQRLSDLLRGLPGTGPRVCFVPPGVEALAALKPGARWGASPALVVARHSGEAALFEASGFQPEQVITLHADLQLAARPEPAKPGGAPLRVGFSWHNLAPAQRTALAAEIARWRASAPNRIAWTLMRIAGDPLDQWSAPCVEERLIDALRLTERPGLDLDVLLVDPWWPDAQPRPCRAAVHLFLSPGGGSAEWRERLQALLSLGSQPDDGALLGFCFQPLWRRLLREEAQGPGSLGEPAPGTLAEASVRWQRYLEGVEAAWGEQVPEQELAFYFWIYDYRAEIAWCRDLWETLGQARNGERHACLLALNALRTRHGTAAGHFKRMLARHRPMPGLGKRYWLHFAWRHPRALLELGLALWRHEEATAIMARCRQLAGLVLQEAGITIRRLNEPAPLPQLPIIYLLVHRHPVLDPFFMLHGLNAAILVGPRARHWPFMGRLRDVSGFVVSGGERGVVIADAIAALRDRRALALCPEIAPPSYLGEGSPIRAGLRWIIQAVECCQVIPVALDDAFSLDPPGGELRMRFGEPIRCTPENRDALPHMVRLFYHRHLPRLGRLDGSGTLERRVPEAAIPVAKG